MTEHLEGRTIQRNCGQLLGHLNELLPFLYIAEYGASGRFMRKRTTEVAEGLFAVGAQTGGDRPGIAPRVGLILPLSLCRDEKARKVLLGISELINNMTHITLHAKRHAVQARLDDLLNGNLIVADKESINGFFALTPNRDLFQWLHESFDYVTDVLDNASGVAHVTGTNRFYWRSYGELMEWYHTLRGSNRSGAWPTLTPFFVCGKIIGVRNNK